MPSKRSSKIEYGDFQTPVELAEQVVALVRSRLDLRPSTVVEPTCGVGHFLSAGGKAFPRARLLGMEINQSYLLQAMEKMALLDAGDRAELRQSDFFQENWNALAATLQEPVLVIGNPPWVTSAALGTLGSRNLPKKTNLKGLNGLDAVTGKSNFDISEWMLIRLLEAFQGKEALFAMLCKTAVARKLAEFALARRYPFECKGIWKLDSKLHFDASVDACLFVFSTAGRTNSREWPVYAALEEVHPFAQWGYRDGHLVSDVAAFEETIGEVAGRYAYEWRSGVKHDAAGVMEFTRDGSIFTNGYGEQCEIEDTYVYPLFKSSDIARGRIAEPRKWVLVTQQRVGEETADIGKKAPRTWAYLQKHKDILLRRSSMIYKKQPPFSIFGIGPYSFAPWKVAVSGLYKSLEFRAVGPVNGRPVMLDDTCYFVAAKSAGEASRIERQLRNPRVQRFLTSLVFWDSKRPVTKDLLDHLAVRRQGVPPESGSVQLALP